jgi:hypothetical protein
VKLCYVDSDQSFTRTFWLPGNIRRSCVKDLLLLLLLLLPPLLPLLPLLSGKRRRKALLCLKHW